MADEYDPFGIKKSALYQALLGRKESVPDPAVSYARDHAWDGGILGAAETNPHGWDKSPLPFDTAELRGTSPGESRGAFKERPSDPVAQPIAEAISPTMGAYGAGQALGETINAGRDLYDSPSTEGAVSFAATAAPLLAMALPVPGMKGVPKVAREINESGFYSPSLEAAKALPQETGTVQQFKSMLLKQGGKPKELEAMGFDKAFPDPQAKVSRGEIEGFLRGNRVGLGQQEFTKPSIYTPGDDQPRYESYSTPGGIPGSYREVVTTLPSKPDMDVVRSRQDAIRSQQNAMEQQGKHRTPEYAALSEEYKANQQKLGAATEFGSGEYTSSHWPGVTNPLLHYRIKDFVSGNPSEQVGALTPSQPSLPIESGRNSGSSSQAYGSGEGDQVSAGDAGSLKQNKVRVLDELQSDWAQRARDQGTRDPARTADLKSQLEANGVDYSRARADAEAFVAKSDAPDWVKKNKHLADQLKWVSENASDVNLADEAAHLKTTYESLYDKNLDLTNKLVAVDRGTPNAPFIGNTSDWVDLGLKQVLSDAVKDPSVTRLAWAPGGVQADRYNLSNHVRNINVDPNGNRGRTVQLMKHGGGSLGELTVDKDGTVIQAVDLPQDLKGKHLSEVIGKEFADQAMAVKKKHIIVTEGVKIGGEGQRAFYGDFTPEGSYNPGIVGTRLLKLLKALDPEGAKIEPQRIGGHLRESALMRKLRNNGYSEETDLQTILADNGGRLPSWLNVPESEMLDTGAHLDATPSPHYPSVTITPKMREKIKKDGFPLFNFAAPSLMVWQSLKDNGLIQDDDGEKNGQ